MKFFTIDNDKKNIEEYIGALKELDGDVEVHAYTVADEYRDIVINEIDRLKYPLLSTGRRIHVKTFGKLEIFIDGVPFVSKYNKTRELFAFLVDKNGALSSTREIMNSLWDDRGDHRSYMKNVRADLIATLKKMDVVSVLVIQHGRLGVIPDLIDCDYYDMLAGKDEAIAKYAGEYMNQYSWAEYTNAVLSDIKAESMD